MHKHYIIVLLEISVIIFPAIICGPIEISPPLINFNNSTTLTIPQILEKYKTQNLNEIVNKFLTNSNTNCLDKDNSSSTKAQYERNVLCFTFLDVLLHLAGSSQKLYTTFDIEKELSVYAPNSNSSDQFCWNIASVIPATTSFIETKEYVEKAHNTLLNSVKCSNICFQENVEHNYQVKPICPLILWGYKTLRDNKPTTNQSFVVAAIDKSTIKQIPLDQSTSIQSNDPLNSEPNESFKPFETVIKPQPLNNTNDKIVTHQSDSNTSKKTEDDHQLVVTNNVEPKLPDTVSNPTTLKPNVSIILTPPSIQIPDVQPNEPKVETSSKPIAPILAEATTNDPLIFDKSDKSNEDMYEEADPNDVPDLNRKSPPLPKDEETFQLETKIEDPFIEEEGSNFFTYLLFLMFVCITGYIVYHNKSKVLALILEGRRSSHSGRGGGIGKRKHTAAYRKLDSNLEEAITSNTSGRTTQIIY